MKFTITKRQDAVCIQFSKSLAGRITREMREELVDLVQPGKKIQVDFSRVERLTSTAIRRLLLFCRYVHAMGGIFSAQGAPKALLDMAEAAGFLELFRQAPSVPAVTESGVYLGRIDYYPTLQYKGYGLRIGVPFPLGATELIRGINFAVYTHHGATCELVLFKNGDPEPWLEIPFPTQFRIGDVFAMTVFNLDPEDLEYAFRVDGPFEPAEGHRFDRSNLLLDPTARCLVGREVWGEETSPAVFPFRSRMIPEDFDWEGDRPLGLPIEDLVIYEMHVRGFTRSPSSEVKFPGTFAGVREKIPYLKQLGINCVELMPIFEFDELENPRHNPETGERLYNYWGYSTIGFWAPKAGYAASGLAGMQADEFKTLVKELHRNGIEVILDVVFNHTGEGNELGPTLSFRGLDNRTYYMLTPDGHYYNFSGCGNTLNCNHPVVREFVLNCLRYWVAEYHIDGFRFDLASILSRDSSGHPLPNPPLLEALAMDPVLSQTKLIAEAWDAGGLYQVGSFPAYGRWAEWNGKFRDCTRKFLKGDLGQVSEVAKRLLGSPDLYPTRGPAASVNFITCHDGFTLADLVSYNEKHNKANGENNRDGANDNHSWNCGVEGPTDDPDLLDLRHRQMKNALAMLFLSHGVPMLLMGDECGRTQRGNNNAYCQDGPLSWFDWTLPETNQELFRFCRELIGFRRRHPLFHPRTHEQAVRNTNRDFVVNWHSTRQYRADWSAGSRVLAYSLHDQHSPRADWIYVAMNMYWEPLLFELPSLSRERRWHLAIDTFRRSPEDIFEAGEEPILWDQTQIEVEGRSIIVLLARTHT